MRTRRTVGVGLSAVGALVMAACGTSGRSIGNPTPQADPPSLPGAVALPTSATAALAHDVVAATPCDVLANVTVGGLAGVQLTGATATREAAPLHARCDYLSAGGVEVSVTYTLKLGRAGGAGYLAYRAESGHVHSGAANVQDITGLGAMAFTYDVAAANLHAVAVLASDGETFVVSSTHVDRDALIAVARAVTARV